MSKNLLDISEKIDEPTKMLFEDFASLASEVNWFVVGAAARDMLICYLYGIEGVQATYDVDMGVQLESWESYHEIKTRLLSSGKFTKADQIQRVVHHRGLPLDLVPFGTLAKPNFTIQWPPENNPQMSIVGYDDALKAALRVRISHKPPLDIRVATPPSIAFLKLIAWAEGPERRRKDVQDLLFILRHYLDLDNWDRLSGEHRDLTDEPDFQPDTAAAQLLGRDMARIASPHTIKTITSILDCEIMNGSASRLVAHMMRFIHEYEDSDPIALLTKLRRGLLEDFLPLADPIT
jgi:predicted nucleotidyltransferase